MLSFRLQIHKAPLLAVFDQAVLKVGCVCELLVVERIHTRLASIHTSPHHMVTNQSRIIKKSFHTVC